MADDGEVETQPAPLGRRPYHRCMATPESLAEIMLAHVGGASFLRVGKTQEEGDTQKNTEKENEAMKNDILRNEAFWTAHVAKHTKAPQKKTVVAPAFGLVVAAKAKEWEMPADKQPKWAKIMTKRFFDQAHLLQRALSRKEKRYAEVGQKHRWRPAPRGGDAGGVR